MLDAEVDGVTTIPEATALCGKFAASLGYPYFVLGLRLLQGPAKARRVVLTNYPQEWLRRYEDSDLASLDPVSEFARKTIVPFVWHEMDQSDKRTSDIFAEARKFGVPEGFTVPIHCPGQEYVMLSVCGASVPAPGVGRTMQFMQGWYFACSMAARVTEIIRRSDQSQSLEPLSERERKVLILIAQGFAIEKAAEKIGIARRTAAEDLKVASEKLGVASREQALVRALACGEIELLAFPEEVDISHAESTNGLARFAAL